MSKRSDRPECFYCGALVSGNGAGDHFPIPLNAGGTETVPCCVSCHDMKDRFALDSWPIDWVAKIVADFPHLSRETRLFLARALRGFAEANRERDSVASLIATIAAIREASGVGNTVMLSDLPREIAAMRARLEELADIVAGRRPIL
jgi:hypothetical protein